MKKEILSKILKNIAIVFLFLVISYGFVYPVISGKVVNQSDVSGYIGMAHQTTKYNDLNKDNPTYWTDSMFSGMPVTSFYSVDKGNLFKSLYDFLNFGKRPATYIFISLLGSFLLMFALGIEGILAIGGAIAITFCAYNLQIIQVGHNTKMQAIAFVPWVLAALIFACNSIYKQRKWFLKALFSSSLFAVAISLQIKANHQQITYYLAIMIVVYALVELCSLFKKDKREYLKRFCVLSLLLLFLGLIGIFTNANKLLPLYQYTKHTMRGGSELSASAQNKDINSKGLSLAYATAWSYGFDELPNLFVPNYKGGSSMQSLNPEKSNTIKLLRDYGQENTDKIAKALPLYWGPQPFTAGPMYIGIITVFLFLLALFLYKGKEKYWLIIVSLIAILLASGNHFMSFTKLCFEYLPLYNKFRTVSMALIILQFSVPILAFILLRDLFAGKFSINEVKKSLLYSFALLGGFMALIYCFPNIVGTFSSHSDQGQPEVLIRALRLDRQLILLQDIRFCAFFLVAVFCILYLSFARKNNISEHKYKLISTALTILIFINLFVVGKRFLNSEHFIAKETFNSIFDLRKVDEKILQDNKLSYRVLDLTVDCFNDSKPSYYHKNIGGYSPAKLQRYQDLISHYIIPEIKDILQPNLFQNRCFSEIQETLSYAPVISMLNTRYFILNDDTYIFNFYCFGNAWFVDRLDKVNSPDEELASLSKINLKNTAVSSLESQTFVNGGKDSIVMVSYKPNELIYVCHRDTPACAVFSEIYYKDGWKAYLQYEDKLTELPIFRANWILRALLLPKGDYKIIMKFEPNIYEIASTISLISSIILLLILVVSTGTLIYHKRRI